MSYNRYHKPKPSRFAIGDVVTVPGLDNAPTAKVVRHTQFDNGEAEILWFTPDQRLQRAWVPEALLQKPRREIGPGQDWRFIGPNRDWFIGTDGRARHWGAKR